MNNELKQRRNQKYRMKSGIVNREKLTQLTKTYHKEMYDYILKYKKEMTMQEIADELNRSRQALYKIMKEFKYVSGN